jgi:hypothetical protein
MSYQKFNRYPDYETIYIPSEKRTNQALAYETTGKYVFCADHSRKKQRVYEVVTIERYAGKVKREERKRANKLKRVDPDFSVQTMYDSNDKTWI